MGEIVDLGTFRKQKEEEEKAKAEEKERQEKERIEREEQEEYEYLSELVNRIMVSLSSLVSGASPEYYSDQGYYPEYSTEDFEVTTYFHEAGYDEDGEYYEKSWEFEPWGDVIDDDDREPDI